MVKDVKIMAIEKFGNSGYYRYTADQAAADDEYNSLCSCFAKAPDLPKCKIGDVVKASVYRTDKGNQFDFI